MNDKFMKEPIVKVEHLSHRYSIQWAVRDISFEIPVRGIYGLLGSNGAGKSTTMNIVCGVIKQTDVLPDSQSEQTFFLPYCFFQEKVRATPES